jgi:hypothetical protein
MHRQDFACFAACLAIAGAGASAQDQQVSIGPSKDNTLYQDDLGSFSNGAGQYMFVGTTNSNLLRRAVIAFDIAGNIPTGSTIQSATLTLNMSKTMGAAIDVDLRPAMQDWGEGTSQGFSGEGGGAPSTPGDATWRHTFYDSQFWNSEGGDFVTAPSATTSVGGIGQYSWSTTAMAADVQGWLDNPSTNFGWGLVATSFEYLTGAAKRFGTRENTDPSSRPVLQVTYTPPMTTGAANIPALKDNTLYQDDLGSLSNGAGEHMFVGTTASNLVRRALIAFDVASNVPVGSTILTASLTLSMSQTRAGAIDVDLLAASQDWGEGSSVGEGGGAPATPGDATWIHTFFDTQLWNAAGGDFAAVPSATTTVDQVGIYTWSDTGVVSDVQAWLDNPPTNFGWGLVATNFEAVPETAKRFDTRENSDPAAQPVLSVTFLPPP